MYSILRTSVNPPSSCSGGGSNSCGRDVHFFLGRIHFVPLVMSRHLAFSGCPTGFLSMHHAGRGRGRVRVHAVSFLAPGPFRRQRQCCCQLKNIGGRHGRVLLFIKQYGIVPRQASSTVHARHRTWVLPTTRLSKKNLNKKLTGAAQHQGAPCHGSTLTCSSCYSRRRGRGHDLCRD